MERIWMVASGKGGVGKSTLTAALGVALTRAGKKVVLVDMDIGLRSLDIHLGMENSVVYDVLDYIRGDCKLTQAVLTHLRTPDLGLLPAAQLGKTGDVGAERLGPILRKLARHFDYVLVDSPAGLERGVETIMECVENVLLVVTPDDVSVRDAERMIALCREKGKATPMIVLNRVVPELVQSGDMMTPQAVADTLDVPLLGYVPEDIAVLKALLRHQTVMDTDGPAGRAVGRIAARMMGCAVPMRDAAPPQRAKKKWFGRRRRGETQ